MSKYCNNCGFSVPDEMNFCQNCGTPVELRQEPPVQPAYQPAAPKNPTGLAAIVQNFLERLKSDRRFLYICLGGVAAVIAVVAIICLVAGGNSYTKPIDNLIALTVDGKSSAIKKMAPAAYWEWYEERYDKTVKDLIDEHEDAWEDSLDALEDRFGDNVRMSYEVLRVKDLKENTLEDIAQILENRYDIPAKTVTDGKEVNLLLTIEGDDEDEGWNADVMTCTMIKIKGAWYYVNYYSGNVSFILGN